MVAQIRQICVLTALRRHADLATNGFPEVVVFSKKSRCIYHYTAPRHRPALGNVVVVIVIVVVVVVVVVLVLVVVVVVNGYETLCFRSRFGSSSQARVGRLYSLSGCWPCRPCRCNAAEADNALSA